MDAAILARAQNTCENLVNQIKNSKLNFFISETPYSVNICMKKRFIKEFSSNNSFLLQEIDVLSSDSEKSNLIEENKVLKLQLEKSQAENVADKKVIEMLEEKMEKAESEVYSHFKETKKVREALEKVTGDETVLKNVINDLNKEATKNKTEINQFSKVIKAKDKEIHNLENKALNLQDTIKNIKEKNKELKKDKTNIEKEVKIMKQKNDKKLGMKDRNQNVSSVDKETEMDSVFDCEVCEKTLKNTNGFPLPPYLTTPTSITGIMSSTKLSHTANSMLAPATETRTPPLPPDPTHCSPSTRTSPCSPFPRTPHGSPSASTLPPSKATPRSPSPRTPPCSSPARTPQGSPSLSTTRDEAEVKNNVFDLSADEFGQLLSELMSKYTYK